MKKLTTRGSIAALALASGMTLSPLSTPQASATVTPALPSSPEVALTWAPEYMNSYHQFTQTEAVSVAKRFDVVAAMPAAFKDYTTQMRSANPHLTLLAYSNAMFADSGMASTVPESAFAHNANGGRITSRDFGLYLMEPSNAAWERAAAAGCAKRATAGGYDGCLLDMLTMAVYNPGYVSSMPAVPGTSRQYTATEWRTQLVTLISGLRAANADLIQIGNAVGNSYRYWDEPVTTQPIVDSLSGAQMEDFLRGSFDGVDAFPTASEWVQNVGVIRDFEQDHRTGFFSTKLWVGQTMAQTQQWQSYAMASFLMGAGGHSYFAFTPSRNKAGATGTNSPYSMPNNLGAPVTGMQETAGIYKRSFANGLSLVNPGKVPTTVKLNTSLTDLDGNRVSEVLLAPRSGMVLVNPASGVIPNILQTENNTAGLDLINPTGDITSINVTTTSTGNRVVISGVVSDNAAVKSATVTLQRNDTGQWLDEAGNWATYARIPVTLSASGATSATWSKAFMLPRGSFGVGLQVEDTSGNDNFTAPPWQNFQVS